VLGPTKAGLGAGPRPGPRGGRAHPEVLRAPSPDARSAPRPSPTAAPNRRVATRIRSRPHRYVRASVDSRALRACLRADVPTVAGHSLARALSLHCLRPSRPSGGNRARGRGVETRRRTRGRPRGPRSFASSSAPRRDCASATFGLGAEVLPAGSARHRRYSPACADMNILVAAASAKLASRWPRASDRRRECDDRDDRRLRVVRSGPVQNRVAQAKDDRRAQARLTLSSLRTVPVASVTA
jgi:hypothetical protein